MISVIKGNAMDNEIHFEFECRYAFDFIRQPLPARFVCSLSCTFRSIVAVAVNVPLFHVCCTRCSSLSSSIVIMIIIVVHCHSIYTYIFVCRIYSIFYSICCVQSETWKKAHSMSAMAHGTIDQWMNVDEVNGWLFDGSADIYMKLMIIQWPNLDTHSWPHSFFFTNSWLETDWSRIGHFENWYASYCFSCNERRCTQHTPIVSITCMHV